MGISNKQNGEGSRDDVGDKENKENFIRSLSLLFMFTPFHDEILPLLSTLIFLRWNLPVLVDTQSYSSGLLDSIDIFPTAEKMSHQPSFLSIQLVAAIGPQTAVNPLFV